MRGDDLVDNDGGPNRSGHSNSSGGADCKLSFPIIFSSGKNVTAQSSMTKSNKTPNVAHM